MEEIHKEFNSLRLLIFNISVEINICRAFYYDYMIFLNNIANKLEFAPLYRLATRQKLPFLVSDGTLIDGTWHSETYLLLTKVKQTIINIFEYASRLYDYICVLWREADLLNKGLENYRATFNFLIQNTYTSFA